MASSTSNSVNEKEEYEQQYAIQLATTSVVPMALRAVIELGILEIIEKAGPGATFSPSQIAFEIASLNNPDAPLMLDSILSLLASHRILTCSVANNNQDGQLHRLYGLAPVAKYFIKNQDGGWLTPFLMMIQDKVIMDMWYHLKDAVVEGGVPFDKAHGINAMGYMGKDERFSQIFKASMRDFNPLLMQTILDKYDGFEHLKSLVDVGGGDGSILNMILSKYPSIKGINYDLPQVIENSPSYPGIEHVAGDMFMSIPNGEAIFMKWILHGWDDPDCLKLLKNCYEALPSNGKVIAVDLVVQAAPGTSAASKCLMQSYLCMTSMNPNGKERTEIEFQSLAKQAGFSHVQVACCAFNFSVIEFLKIK